MKMFENFDFLKISKNFDSCQIFENILLNIFISSLLTNTDMFIKNNKKNTHLKTT